MKTGILSGSDFRRSLRGAPSGIFLFFGEEEYTKHHCLMTLRQQLCGDSNTAVFNHVRLSAADASFTLHKITDAYSALPFFSTQKLTEVHDLDFGALGEAQLRDLLDLISGLSAYQNENEQNVLVIYCLPSEFDGGSENRSSALLKKLSALLTAVRFDRETPARLASWVEKHFAAERIMSSPEVCRALIARCGSSMFALDNEVQKLSAYLHANGRERVEMTDIETVVPANPEIGDFDFSNAMLNCDPDGVYTAYAEMKSRRERPELILGSVVSVYDTLYRVQTVADAGRSPSDIAAAFRWNETRVKIYLRACRNFSASFLERAVRACRDADLKLKNASLEPYTVLETLLATLTPRRRGGTTERREPSWEK